MIWKRRKNSRYVKLWKRWIKVTVGTAVIGNIYAFENGESAGTLFLWVIFSLLSFVIIGPGWILMQAISIKHEREMRRLREFNEMWERENRGFCERLRRIESKKIDEMKPTFNDMTGSKNNTYDYLEKL